MSVSSELLSVLSELGEQERAVVLVLARRLLAGQRQYGRLALEKDGRDWERERAEELADALIYGAIAEVARDVRARASTRSIESEA